MSKTTNKFPRQCASAPCNWCLITNMNILSADRRSAIGGTSPTLNEWVKKADVDAGKRAGNWRPIWRPWNGRPGELRQANEILRPNGRLII